MRIHDGAPRERLVQRGQDYVGSLRRIFPYAVPRPGALVMEIGSGLAYVMQAAMEQLAPRQLIGLDVAPSMAQKARARLARDGLLDSRLGFLLYDGVSIPLRDDSVDYVYSVAALQHVPKNYVYNLLFEIKRILAPDGFCALHFLSYSHIANHCVPFVEEVQNQLASRAVHWHHFYSFDELFYVLADGVGAKQIDIADGAMSISAAFGKSGPTFHREDLAAETHLARTA
jgi:ubiquinone/menaquinone biosynthesis C-methylase UbiE